MTCFSLKGWVELDGRRMTPQEVEETIENNPDLISRFGGEFYLSTNTVMARDKYGIIQGDCPAGMIVSSGKITGKVSPVIPASDLETAISEAVRMRKDEGVTALSGGVDSTLVAVLAERPCVVVGTDGSHDLARARHAADAGGLSLDTVILTRRDVEEGLSSVIPVIPSADPVNTAIAVTMYCITKWAGEHGYQRVIAGQGADELFGGYARYLTSEDLAADLTRDFLNLPLQAARDQAVADLHKTYISMPYLDPRVVRAARLIPPSEKVVDGVRKRPLRIVAERFIAREIAWQDKKAMQYGSGVWHVIRDLARHNGYKRSVQGYINQFVGQNHGIRKGC